MTAANQQSASPTTVEPGSNERELVISRVLDAPRELVFKVWSDPKHLTQWWGPKDWSLPVCTVDFRPGGVWQYCMRGPEGDESWGKGVYREIVAPERIVYTDHFTDAQGNPIAGMPELQITVEFIDHGGKTKLVSRTQFASVAELESIMEMGMLQGLTETWDRLEAHLTAEQAR